MQALSDAKKRSSRLNSLRVIGAQGPFPQRSGCLAYRKREKFYFFLEEGITKEREERAKTSTF